MKTIKQIAKAHGVSDRTVRAWLTQARKVLGNDGIGGYEDGRLVFTSDEVNTLASYGRQAVPGSEPSVEVLTPDIEPDQVLAIEPVQSQAPALFSFHIEHLTIQTPRTDTTAIDTQADQYQAISQNAFGAIAQHLTDDLVGMIRTAKSQNRHGVLGAQAMAGTAAIKELQP
jgi:transposase-like protein